MLTPEHVASVVSFIDQCATDQLVESELRKRFPEQHLTLCSIDDIYVGTAVYENNRYALFLVDSSSHCASLTSDLTSANGFVIAQM
ncbi:DUF6129 family protein [Agaribacterium haliotis]|uniref:DUF6129 family protein n=1 Tax=Agaribacterium haliotis TaxID=2013869 RepID=UPI000BB52E72|nr:DUF6129 family protein [Agaribacterium haliotis]